MSTSTSSSRSSPVLRAIYPNSPSRRAHPRQAKSKSLSLPPFPPFPRRSSLASPTSPSKRRFSSRTDTSVIITSPHAESSHMLSPSNLPATDSMSYFPPFEDMGSDAVSASPSGIAAGEHQPSEPGPSRSPSPRRERSETHGKNRSLGSLANFMAWATFTPASENPPHRPVPVSASASKLPSAVSLTDGERLEALSRRFTPGQGKRRVLEPMATQEGVRGVSLLGLTTTRIEADPDGVQQKRRVASEMDVERIMRAGKEETIAGDDEEGDVERVIGWIPTRPHAPRHSLSLPAPGVHLPNWRFPIPSPPITSLSPHIPLEFFQYEISNPASTSPSPIKPTLTFSDLHDQELDEVEGSLLSIDSGLGLGSGSGSSISTTDLALSNPTTPDRSPPRKVTPIADPRFWTPTPQTTFSYRKKSRFRVEGDEEDEEEAGERLEMIFPEKIKLRRTSSSGSKASCDSNTTIKVREGEITPRLGKGWKAVQAG